VFNQEIAVAYAKAAKAAFPVHEDETFEFRKELAQQDLADVLGKGGKGKSKG
jgi:hypothetical protein